MSAWIEEDLLRVNATFNEADSYLIADEIDPHAWWSVNSSKEFSITFNDRNKL